MLNEEKINEIYEKVIEENSTVINRERKHAKIENIIKYIMIIISILAVYKITQLPIVYEKYVLIKAWGVKVGGFYGMLLMMHCYWVFVLLFTLLVIVCLYFILSNKFYTYIHNFNNRMIKKVTEIYNEELEYLQIEGIDEKVYIEEAEFLKFDKYTSNNLIKGTLANKCKLEMAQVVGHYLAPNIGGRNSAGGVLVR